MKLLIVSAVFPPEPVVSSQLSFDIARKMAEEGNAVTVICPPPTRPLGYTFNETAGLPDNFTKVVLRSYTCPESKIIGRFRESLSFGKHCFRFIRNNHKDIDVIYANTWPLFAQYLLIRAAGRYNVPVVLHIQDIYPESLAQKQSGTLKLALLLLFTPLDRQILKGCEKIIAISVPMQDYIVRTRKIDKLKVSVVRNWQNDGVFMNSGNTGEKARSEFVFMYLGTINPSSSVDTLIHAFGKAKLNNCKLIIAGEGSCKAECQKLAEQYSNEKIEFISASLDKVHEIQQIADLLLLPLKIGIAKTATPSKLTAYMLSGKPVIACVEEDTDTANIIKESNCGWIVAPQNIDLLAGRMKMVINESNDDLLKFGYNGLSYAKANLTKEFNLGKVRNILNEIVAK